MDIKIIPSRLIGQIEAISSKSDGHRALICSALCEGKTVLKLNSISQDIEATVACINALGGRAEIQNGKITVIGGKTPNSVILNCNESGSTARFLLPVAAALCENVTMQGGGRLPERPFKEICDAMRQHGCVVSSNNLPIKVNGKLQNGIFEIPGNVSSQYISGLLFALPLLSGDSEIVLTTPLQSTGYVNMTLSTLSAFGIKIENTEKGYFIKGSQKYISPEELKVEGDWSNSAFWFGASAIGNNVLVTGLRENSLQGDKKIVDIANNLQNISELDVSEIPDLVPIISVMFALSNGKRTIMNAGRLRLKESDRIKSVCNMINSLGGNAKEFEDSIEIEGGSLLGGTVDSAYDHRIVMAASIAATMCKNEVIIKNAQAVAKSYPEFFEDYNRLGGRANVL